MTTTYGAVANAMASIHAKHLQAGKPAETVKASMRCPKCSSLLQYQVSVTGVVTGRCNSGGCLRWVM